MTKGYDLEACVKDFKAKHADTEPRYLHTIPYQQWVQDTIVVDQDYPDYLIKEYEVDILPQDVEWIMSHGADGGVYNWHIDHPSIKPPVRWIVQVTKYFKGSDIQLMTMAAVTEDGMSVAELQAKSDYTERRFINLINKLKTKGACSTPKAWQ